MPKANAHPARKRARRESVAGAAAAAAAANRSKQQLYDARRRLVKVAGTAARPVYAGGVWAAAQKALEHHRARLSRYEGVVAVGLGHRRRKGMITDEPCIVVYVEKKHELAELEQAGRRALPQTVRTRRRRIPIDVVEMGVVETHGRPGDSVGRMEPPRTKGTLGAFVTDSTGAIGFVTAMHVAELDEFPGPDASVEFTCPSRVDQSAALRVGALVRGTRSGVDAALVRLDDPTACVNVVPTGEIVGWRPVAAPADLHAPVSLWGATSGAQDGTVEAVDVYVTTLRLDHTILVDIETDEGDSGCALVDPHRAILGFLVGGGAAGRNLKIFTPAGLVFAKLGCDLE